MKKNLTFLSAVLLTLISLKTHAQDEKEYPKSNMSFITGLSIPTGDFAKTDYYNNKAGFAKKGVTFGLDGVWYFYKNLGLGANFSFQDQGEFSNTDAATLSTGYNTDFKKDETTVTAVDRYHSVSLMLGPQYSYIIKKFTIDARVSAGYLKSLSTPSTAVVFDYSTDATKELGQLSSTGRAFSYSGTLGLRYNFSEAWDVGIRFNYLDSGSGINIGNSNNPGTTGRFQTKLPVTLFQTTAGITLRFL